MSEIRYIKLSELTTRLRQVISDAFGQQTWWIVAEVSGHKFYPDKDRHYFDLVEKLENPNTETAKIKANSWEQGSRQIAYFQEVTGQNFCDGLQVLICVRVNYHIVHGLSLTLLDIDPNFTLGNVERQRRETLSRLVQDNPGVIDFVNGQYRTRNSGLQLNRVIQRIALIGSPRSEGYTDFVHTLDQNNFQYKFALDFYYSSVQGAGAEQELVKTLVQVYEASRSKEYDCVVITRGGGARTDFMVFDTYNLARTTARLPIPIITGIGHHKDVSIVDLMVHTQTKTPTKAAEFILAHNRRFEEQVLGFRQNIIIRTQQLLSERNLYVSHVRSRITHKLPAVLNLRKEEISDLKNHIRHKAGGQITSAKISVQKLQQHISNCSSEILHKRANNLGEVYHRIISKPREVVNARSAELVHAVNVFRIHSAGLLNRQKSYLVSQKVLMQAMSPASLLKKGFALVLYNERIVTDGKVIPEGAEITVTLGSADLHSTVNKKTETNGKFDL